MGLALWLFLLLPLLRVPLTLSPSSNLSSERCPAKPSPGSRCGPREYWSGRHCCQCCPAGQYVRKPCSSPHTQGECEACDTGTYTGHANGLPSCQLCTTCRKDQEEVSDCTPTQDRRCQCKTGEYYCDSEHCPEGCYRCTSCPGATLQTCTPTRDTKCAPVAQPEPGPPAGSLSVSALVVSVVAIVIAIAIGIRIAIAWWRRRATSGEPGSHAILRPTDPVRGPPVPGAEITPLLPEKADTPTPGALTHPRPLANPDFDPDPDPNPDTDLDPDPDPDPDTDLDPDPDPDPDPDTDPDSDPDPGAGAELQVEVAGGGLVAPEAAPPTPAAAAPGAQAQAEMDAGLRH
ncbi:tumor necrosis factor receptor superfamily member 6-like isoform X2 [Myotis daubentonii]|uniref:tumor necrosis factor receptor superfamily member 6-like isoform X2 n=1 Tax=Myotis daubentonii TaxID=98922 RepID=UPI002873AE28|nr:tumor necrosis factor receptor superfamily member 6-like isoform X2 [Myotis daubentonii]